MYCPRCGTENATEASYCRSCGADISLVPQALTGRLPASASSGGKVETSKSGKLLSPEQFMPSMFVGIGFLLWFVIGAIFFTRLFPFWFWAIFPGFACLGSGVGQYMRYKREQEREARFFAARDANSLRAAPHGRGVASAARGAFADPAADGRRMAARDTEEIVASFEPRASASVTEGTTRLLDDAPGPAARNAATRERS